MMPFDYSDAPPPQFDLIPAGTICTVSLHIQPGTAGTLKRSKDGNCEMLNLEFTVVDGPFAKRKFWQNFVMSGTTDGHAKAVDISRSTLKAILDSALGLKPDDVSPEARAARTVELEQFEGMTFVAKIGIEKGGPRNEGGTYDDKNKLAGVVTRDSKEWHPVEQPSPFDGNSGTAISRAPTAATAAPVARPDWAR